MTGEQIYKIVNGWKGKKFHLFCRRNKGMDGTKGFHLVSFPMDYNFSVPKDILLKLIDVNEDEDIYNTTWFSPSLAFYDYIEKEKRPYVSFSNIVKKVNVDGKTIHYVEGIYSSNDSEEPDGNVTVLYNNDYIVGKAQDETDETMTLEESTEPIAQADKEVSSTQFISNIDGDSSNSRPIIGSFDQSSNSSSSRSSFGSLTRPSLLTVARCNLCGKDGKCFSFLKMSEKGKNGYKGEVVKLCRDGQCIDIYDTYEQALPRKFSTAKLRKYIETSVNKDLSVMESKVNGLLNKAKMEESYDNAIVEKVMKYRDYITGRQTFLHSIQL